jgi:hypothetical protein
MSNDELNSLRLEESAKYGKKEIKKFFNKLSKSKKVSELKMTGEYSFTFKFNDEYNTIAFHIDSDCMVINSGLGDPFTDNSSEIGFYELAEHYF